MSLPRLIMFVEGKGDVDAVPRLAKRLVQAQSGFEVLTLSPQPFRVGNLGSLVKNDCKNWKRWLGAAAKQKPFAGVLLVLDGDIDEVPPKWDAYISQFGRAFCPARVAALLGSVARAIGAGNSFSVAIVFAMKEFESWIIAGIEGVRGAELASGRGRVSESVEYPSGVAVETVRDAKGLLIKQVPEYEPSFDQGILASKLDLDWASKRSRSFKRMSSAVAELTSAVRGGRPVATPAAHTKN